MSKKLLVLSLPFVCLLLAAGLPVPKGEKPAEADERLARMLDISQTWMTENPLILVRLGSPYFPFEDKADFHRMAEDLRSSTGLPAAGIQYKNDHLVYVTGLESSAVSVRLQLTGTRDGASWLSLNIRTHQPSAAPAVAEIMKKWETTLADRNVTPHWNLIIQGEIREHRQRNFHPKLVHEDIMRRLNAEPTGHYEENGTFSRTWHAPGLQSAGLGKHTNLQSAFHRHSETGVWRMTLGTPAIPIEF